MSLLLKLELITYQQFKTFQTVHIADFIMIMAGSVISFEE